VLLLLKAIYGMPPAGREFWKLLRSIIVGLGFKQSEHAHCFYFRRTKAGFVIIMTYNMLTTSPSPRTTRSCARRRSAASTPS
jgi:hypothetical protein